jgi:hypothetical protein
MRTITNSDTGLGRWAIDELPERYVAWCEECRAVWQAYQRWIDSERGERRVAFAGYLAALDREERAAQTYAEQIKQVRWIST